MRIGGVPPSIAPPPPPMTTAPLTSDATTPFATTPAPVGSSASCLMSASVMPARRVNGHRLSSPPRIPHSPVRKRKSLLILLALHQRNKSALIYQFFFRHRIAWEQTTHTLSQWQQSTEISHWQVKTTTNCTYINLTFKRNFIFALDCVYNCLYNCNPMQTPNIIIIIIFIVYN